MHFRLARFFVLFGCFYLAYAASNRSERPSLKACRSYQPSVLSRPYQPSVLSRFRRDSLFDLRFGLLHGYRTLPAEFPYMVALGWETASGGSYEYKCGGVLISPQHVLTAGHCVTPTKPLVVLPGGVQLVNYTSSEPFKIAEIVIHPKYKTGFIYDDIAVIKMEKSISFSDSRKPICLWRNNRIDDNMPITAIGYGLTETGKQSMELLKGYLATVSNAKCNEIFKNFNSAKKGILKSQVCAKDPNEFQATCKGDSGGPLVLNRFEEGVTRSYVLGITSQGVGCGTKFPGIYTRVSSYLSWIEKIVWK